MSISLSLLAQRDHPPVSVAQMKSIEEKAKRSGVGELIMMENAGSAIASYIVSALLERQNRASRIKRLKAVFVGGTGNNGGDTFAAARHLAYWRNHFEIIVVLLGDPKEIRTEEAKKNWEIISRISRIKKVTVPVLSKAIHLQRAISKADIIIVGIFGIGFHGTPKELQRIAIDAVNRDRGALVVSVDVPSGLEADTGRCEYSVSSDATICLHAAKVGMFRNASAKQKCGKIIIANLGLPF